MVFQLGRHRVSAGAPVLTPVARRNVVKDMAQNTSTDHPVPADYVSVTMTSF